MVLRKKRRDASKKDVVQRKTNQTWTLKKCEKCVNFTSTLVLKEKNSFAAKVGGVFDATPENTESLFYSFLTIIARCIMMETIFCSLSLSRTHTHAHTNTFSHSLSLSLLEKIQSAAFLKPEIQLFHGITVQLSFFWMLKNFGSSISSFIMLSFNQIIVSGFLYV